MWSSVSGSRRSWALLGPPQTESHHMVRSIAVEERGSPESPFPGPRASHIKTYMNAVPFLEAARNLFSPVIKSICNTSSSPDEIFSLQNSFSTSELMVRGVCVRRSRNLHHCFGLQRLIIVLKHLLIYFCEKEWLRGGTKLYRDRSSGQFAFYGRVILTYFLICGQVAHNQFLSKVKLVK